MALTIQEALELHPGTLLSFQNEHLYEVLSVEPRGASVYLALKREDDFETHATQHDLHKAEIVPGDGIPVAPVEPEPEPEPIQPVVEPTAVATEHGSEADELDIASKQPAEESAPADDKADEIPASSTNRRGKGNRS